jgi:transposase InsO family protein
MTEAGVVVVPRMLICDRDRKWSHEVRRLLGDAGIDVVLTFVRAPNANAYAERSCDPLKKSVSSG